MLTLNRSLSVVTALLALFFSMDTAQGADFTLQDHIGRTWSNEFVSFPATPVQVSRAKAGDALAKNGRTNTPYQLFEQDGEQRIAFMADLAPFETQAYSFVNSRAPVVPDAPQVIAEADSIVLKNNHLSLALRKVLSKGKGPIAGMVFDEGGWRLESTLNTPSDPTSCEMTVSQQGPVFAEVQYNVAFGEGREWLLTFRLHRNEPVILIDEVFNVSGTDTAWGVNLSKNYAPDTLIFREGKGKNEQQAWTIQGDDIWELRPWTPWWIKPQLGPCFSLFKAGELVKPTMSNAGGLFAAKEQDELSLQVELDGISKPSKLRMLTVATRHAGNWIDPTVPAKERFEPLSRVKRYNGTMWLPMNLHHRGVRSWLIAALPANDAVRLLENGKKRAPTRTDPFAEEPMPPDAVLLQDRTFAKHGIFPLEVVKDYILDWNHSNDTYPRLFLTTEALPAFRRTVKDRAPYEKAVAGMRKNRLSQYALGGEINPNAVYFVTGDAGVADNVACNAIKHMQQTVDYFLDSPGVSFGTQPHVARGNFLVSPGLADVGLASKSLPEKERKRLLAQIAFLSYTFDSPDYWSPARGYAANPNMTTTVNNHKLILACLIPSHPRAKEWASNALEELKKELMTWSDENGGWLEAPHYATVSINQIIASLTMAYNAGLDDSLYSPRLKKVASWLGKISTPPDASFGGYRHMPEIGNTYLNEATGVFGTMAYIWRERDPKFAAGMEWMWQQQRSLPGQDLSSCNHLLQGSGLTPQVPDWGSELFPGAGAVLRHGFPSDRETYLHLIAGRFRQHYDYDSGSLILWGKGRQLAGDFGYYGRAPDAHHSLLKAKGVGSVMSVKDFKRSPRLDVIVAVNGSWKRQIALVKPVAVNGDAYIVLADTLASETAYDWRLWLAARNLVVGPEAADYRGPVGKAIKGGKNVDRLIDEFDLEADIEDDGFQVGMTPPALKKAPSDGTKQDARFTKPLLAQRALMIGREDVDMDIFLNTPVMLHAKTLTVKSNMGYDAKGKMVMPVMVTQIGLMVKSEKGHGHTTLLYPRLKTAPPPEVTVIAEGKGMKITHSSGTDYVFISSERFTYSEGPLSFTGTVGLVQSAQGKSVLTLGAPGRLSYGTETVEAL